MVLTLLYSWIVRKYQQGLFVIAAKGFMQLKIDKADSSTVRKSGLKKHVWFQAWGMLKDDKLEVYSDYPPKVCPPSAPLINVEV